MKRPAAFVDRDGTIIRDANYIRDPAHVELLPGAAEAIRRLNEKRVAVIIVTNQSGIARGWLTGEDYEAVQQRLTELLAAEGAHVLATYYCPHSPEKEPACECRKPGPALYRQAAAEHGLDLARSWYVGDRLRDIQPARTFGGRGVLVPRDTTPGADVVAARDGFAISTSLGAAVDRMLAALPLSSTPHSG